MDFVIITDSNSDLPLEFIEQNKIPVISFNYTFKGKEYVDDFGKTIKYTEFYDEVRNGEMPSTSQINVYTYTEIFKNYVREGKGIIYIGFSSALSGSLNNAMLARNTIIEELPDADITVLDSRNASLGSGLIVYYAYDMYKKGHTKSEIVDWINENKFKFNSWFTVNDLNHLKRGGRVSGASAFMGTILSIKPILNVDNQGRLIPIYKVKGRKQSLKRLVDKFEETVINSEVQVIGISHGDCLEDAKYVEKLILEKYNVKDVLINNIGPVIGSHSGPSTVALFYMGKEKI